jgi:DNA repair protein RadC
VKDRSKFKIDSSRKSHEYFQTIFENDMGLDMVESAYAIYLSRNNNVIGWVKLSQGGLTGTVIDVRLVLSYALQCLAPAIVIAHNHPSGNLKPSQADINITNKLREACSLFEIRFLDHLIVSSDGYYSFADEGMM